MMYDLIQYSNRNSFDQSALWELPAFNGQMILLKWLQYFIFLSHSLSKFLSMKMFVSAKYKNGEKSEYFDFILQYISIKLSKCISNHKYTLIGA